MDNIEWVDKPPDDVNKRAKDKWARIARQLKERPGEWAKVDVGVPPSRASLIRGGGYVSFRPQEHWEVRTHTQDDGRIALYMRYVGPPKEEPDV